MQSNTQYKETKINSLENGEQNCKYCLKALNSKEELVKSSHSECQLSVEIYNKLLTTKLRDKTMINIKRGFGFKIGE